ncbi:uncharacterized protein LTR77_007020 [Saxophila tyrrhenica]|uniref:Uncharacterized protein n=1 Tax=Saxophila tyrrhenica TaxID=1690608 RepID=A0AAV9P9W8_9PEZI|nr:hypothetical protein LTR77_007020 [Saxophila tyrrhenica]
MHFSIRSVALIAAVGSAVVESSPLRTGKLGSSNAFLAAKRALEKRDITLCNGWAPADQIDIAAVWAPWTNSGDTATVAAGACSRVGCSEASGIYVCNDQSVDIEVDLGDVGSLASDIKNTCYDGPSGMHEGFSGQLFTDGYNVNVASCDTNANPATRPSDL